MTMGDPHFNRSFATEDDRINCPFYFKIGACRNGDRCNRAHVRPSHSQTILIPNMYTSTPEGCKVSADEDWDEETYLRAQEHAEASFADVFLELAKYGEVEDMIISDNVSEHMMGNIYVKYYREADAANALRGMANRFFGTRLLQGEYSPVVNFNEARCRAFHETRCARGGLCNFLHIKHIPKAVRRRVTREMYEQHPEFGKVAPGQRDRSRSRERKQKEKEEAEANKPKRQTSEERRAMIAEWNKEEQAKLLAGHA